MGYKTLCCLCCESGPISAVITTNKTERRVVAEIRRGRIGPGTSDYWEGVMMRVPALPPTNLAGTCNIIDVQYRLDFHVDPSGMSFDLVVSLPITIGTIPLQEYIPTLAPPPPYFQEENSRYDKGGMDPSWPDKGGYPPAQGQGGYPQGQGGYPQGQGGYPPVQGQGGYPPIQEQGGYPSAPPGGGVPPSGWNPPNNAFAPEWNPSAPPALEQFSQYPSLPPPTYEESVWGVSDVRHRDDDEHTQGDWEFVPRYVLYNTR